MSKAKLADLALLVESRLSLSGFMLAGPMSADWGGFSGRVKDL